MFLFVGASPVLDGVANHAWKTSDMALVITLALGWKIYYLIFNAMLGLIPRCNIYSTMFFSVLTTFLTFLLWCFEVITNRNIEYCQKKILTSASGIPSSL